MKKRSALLTGSIILNILLLFIIVSLILSRQGLLNVVDEDVLLENNESIEQDDNSNQDSNGSNKDVEEENKEIGVVIYYFDRDKFDIPDNVDYLTEINRTTTRKDVATFSIEQIIEGPTEYEKEEYNVEETFGDNRLVWFVSETNCNGKDFTVEVVEGRAVVKFCRQVKFVGDMSGMIVEDQIRRTLKQFITVDEVQILNVGGSCFNDMAGFDPEECVS